MKKENTFIMTAEGFLEAENELNELKNVRRPEVIKALKESPVEIQIIAKITMNLHKKIDEIYGE